ncbi:hypothetical protein BRADI_3g50245v3 [Brachypodium distachyon]|uniref:Uncharacterized protein n=1 Tax=Brachypodium distachyon TaxID=15368 RepID=A0A2K2D4F8_BRADI|nr:hypothetical protein BRADI_3g50245v3 [Brachypodium distachyon]
MQCTDIYKTSPIAQHMLYGYLYSTIYKTVLHCFFGLVTHITDIENHFELLFTRAPPPPPLYSMCIQATCILRVKGLTPIR